MTVAESPSVHWSVAGAASVRESLAEEGPLAIEIAYERGGQTVRRLLGVTMRTPGHDEELTAGFLHGEGILAQWDYAAASAGADRTVRGEELATWVITLRQPPRESLERVSRNLLTTSACGLCGRTSLEGLAASTVTDAGSPCWDPALLARLPEQLRMQQPLFALTGGSHGAGLASPDGVVSLVREDVGRHNAVDKLIGAALIARRPLDGSALVLSGRASFELVQKAAAAGIPLVLAVGAPSSLAARLAHEAGITLVGFARGDRFNVYTHAVRIHSLA